MQMLSKLYYVELYFIELVYFGGVLSSHSGTYMLSIDDVFTYNQIVLIYLRSRSHVNASMILMRAIILYTNVI